MIDFTASYTDKYQLSMSQVYYLEGMGETRAVFDYFFRKLPFGGGYAVFAGLEDVLDILSDFRFDNADLDYLRNTGFDPSFVKYLEDFRFSGNIFSSSEGDLVFPVRPVLQIEASLIEAQIIETLILNILNFQTLIATKASRMRKASDDKILIDFGLRRAQGPGGYYASRAAFIGGFDGTSNVRAARDYNIPASGTMAHSFIESFTSEQKAFEQFAERNPEGCVLVVDTYDTLSSGLPNAVKAAKKMEAKGKRLFGIRLDSGDLAYLSKECRKILDNEGLSYVKIAVSNQLDEFIIRSLLEQQAPIDVFGVGTSLVTGHPDAALDGVYKMAMTGDRPTIKISENIAKITLPHRKQVYRMTETGGRFTGADAIALHDEEVPVFMKHPLYPLKSMSLQNFRKEPLLKQVMKDGKRSSEKLSLSEIADYSRSRLEKLPEEYKRFDNPHIYKIGISSRLQDERDKLIEKHKNELI